MNDETPVSNQQQAPIWDCTEPNPNPLVPPGLQAPPALVTGLTSCACLDLQGRPAERWRTTGPWHAACAPATAS